ncbi:MAG: oxidase [Nitrospiraceae bacterium]|nr:oxidase [Nitrospiraceae bacterium]|tara:strand:+ start:1727 stop:2989 length:1263 start_codon:yes stop_codon:yes gene_type:complete
MINTPISRRELWQWLLSSTTLKLIPPTTAGLVFADNLLHPHRGDASVYDVVRRYYGHRPLVTVKEKKPLISITSRPHNLETPLHHLTHPITPNDVFFVRSRLAITPTDDAESYRLSIHGTVEHPLELTLNDLKTQFEPVSITSVAQCAGNSMAFFNPPVFPGWNLTHGFMGCATWTGVRVRDVLSKVGLKANAHDVVFKGADRPSIDKTPLVEKSFRLTIDQTLDEDLLIAYAMNGHPLPRWNGYPVRLAAPGWYGTYWVKWLESITVIPKAFDGFWMSNAYRIPAHPVEPYKHPGETIPVTRCNVKSVITSPQDNDRVNSVQPIEITGVAFDAGNGIRSVDISVDGGRSWHKAKLHPVDGRYAWNTWSFIIKPKTPGKLTIMSRATNTNGETQPMKAIWNPGGYKYNAIDSIDIIVPPR